MDLYTIDHIYRVPVSSDLEPTVRIDLLVAS